MITWALKHRLGRLAAHLTILVFISVQVVMFVRSSAPVQDGERKPYPWGMFKNPSSKTKALEVMATLESGERVRIDPHQFYHYSRGATKLRFYDHARALRKKRRWARRDTEAFARELVRLAQPKFDKEIVAIDFSWRRRRVGRKLGRVRKQAIHDTIAINKAKFRRLEREERRRARAAKDKESGGGRRMRPVARPKKRTPGPTDFIAR